MRNEQTVSSMLCPVCRTGLSMADRQGIEIDFCPQCRGVWLDRGELDKLIDRSPTGAPAPQQGSAGLRDQERYGDSPQYSKTKRKESFLGDLFDF